MALLPSKVALIILTILGLLVSEITIPPPKFAVLFVNVEFIIEIVVVPFIKIAPPPKSFLVSDTLLALAVLFINVLLTNINPISPPFCKYNAPASFWDQQFWNTLLEIVKLFAGLAYNTPPWTQTSPPLEEIT